MVPTNVDDLHCRFFSPSGLRNSCSCSSLSLSINPSIHPVLWSFHFVSSVHLPYGFLGLGFGLPLFDPSIPSPCGPSHSSLLALILDWAPGCYLSLLVNSGLASGAIALKLQLHMRSAVRPWYGYCFVSLSNFVDAFVSVAVGNVRTHRVVLQLPFIHFCEVLYKDCGICQL